MTKTKKFEFEDEWRIVGKRKANKPHAFLPEALTGVIFGYKISARSRRIVEEIIAQREATNGLRPRVYQARLFEGRIVLDDLRRLPNNA